MSDKVKSIPVDHPMIVRAKTLIPVRFWDRTYVAGSAATRFGQHEDVDVWITDYMEDDPYNITPFSEPSRINAPLRRRLVPEENYDHLATKIYNDLDEKLHVMVSEYQVRELLDRFDITCHMGAVRITDGELLIGSLYTDEVMLGRSIPVPHITLGRYLKFAKRYNDWTKLQDKDVRQCAADVFGLYTYETMQSEMKYLSMDRGL